MPPPHRAALSVVTPTLGRPQEVVDLLADLGEQSRLPDEVVIVDGAQRDDVATQQVVEAAQRRGVPFRLVHVRSERGTAVQRNVGIDLASGGLVAFIDDDVRLDPGFFAAVEAVFSADDASEIGGVVGYRTNQYLGRHGDLPPRWRWYRRLHLLHTFEPGAYDWDTGYPINANLQAPFTGTRPVEFMTTACAVWRREVFDEGLRFDPFFRDYGVLEDAHLSLRAGRRWALVQCGDAHCEEQSATGGRSSDRVVARKAVVNYWYVFNSVAGPLSWRQRYRFWQFQAFEILRVVAHLVLHPSGSGVDAAVGRVQGIASVVRGEVRRALRSGPTDRGARRA